MEDSEGCVSMLRVRRCGGEVRGGKCHACGLLREASGNEQGMGVKEEGL